MNIQTALGLIRSIIVYRMNPLHQWRLRRFYRAIVTDGLVFDVGAHVGDRIGAFRSLGCRVVGVEPQTLMMRFLHLLYGRDKDVMLEAYALGAQPGTADLLVSRRNPTVSSLSRDWVDTTSRDTAFKNVVWDQRERVNVSTLDELIARHGLPQFCKIDVEGFEAEVLRGLHQPLPMLSFEFLTTQRERVTACIAEISRIGYYRFNIAYGEALRFVCPEWQSAESLLQHLENLPRKVTSGDIYARHEP